MSRSEMYDHSTWSRTVRSVRRREMSDSLAIWKAASDSGMSLMISSNASMACCILSFCVAMKAR